MNTKKEKLCVEIEHQARRILNSNEYPDTNTRSEINMGECRTVAEKTYHSLADEVEELKVIMAGDGVHLWLRLQGHAFDAERPMGVPSPEHLPFFERHPPSKILRFEQLAAETEDREQPEEFSDILHNITSGVENNA